MEDLSNEILNDIEKEKLIQFNGDKMMFETVKKYVLAVVYRQGIVEKGKEHNPNINWAMNMSWGAIDPKGMPRTDEELGQNLRAMTTAITLVGSGFKEISEMKPPEKELKEETNPAE